FIHPREFGADLVDGGIGARHLATMFRNMLVQSLASHVYTLFYVVDMVLQEFEFHISNGPCSISQRRYRFQGGVQRLLMCNPKACFSSQEKLRETRRVRTDLSSEPRSVRRPEAKLTSYTKSLEPLLVEITWITVPIPMDLRKAVFVKQT